MDVIDCIRERSLFTGGGRSLQIQKSCACWKFALWTSVATTETTLVTRTVNTVSINKRVALPGLPWQPSQQVQSSSQLSNDAPAPVKWPTCEIAGKF